MAYVNVADWKPEQVVEWLKGLDAIVLPYVHCFMCNNVNGRQLLDMQPDDLEQLGVIKLGHQEVILEAVELLRNFHYELDRENLQLLSLRLSCLAHSLHSELWTNHANDSVVSTQVLADVANVVTAVKPLVCWLDRSPFSGQLSYIDKKNELLKLSLEMATSGQRERFAEKPVENIRHSCKQLAELADSIIQDIDDSLLLQPASLDLATLKKRPGDPLGFYIVPSFHGIHQVGELKCNSAAHQCGKIETGDEIVQINYQTVVGWEVKEVMGLFEESNTEVLLTLKKRPRHSKVFGQIYIKPYRLPCKKQMGYRWHELIASPRTDLLASPHFNIPLRLPPPTSKSSIGQKVEAKIEKSPPSPTPSIASNSSSSSSESELLAPQSPSSVRLYLPKPRIPVQRRATITGASPVSKNAPLSLEQFWHELKLEKEWRSSSIEKANEKANSESQLQNSAVTHSSLNWSARLCDQNSSTQSACYSVPELSEKLEPSKESSESTSPDGIIPLKQRIASFNKAVDQTRKPKILPKPTLESRIGTGGKPHIPARIKSLTPIKIPLGNNSDPTVSPRKDRGKLDKSYSTPSYDFSADTNPVVESKVKRKVMSDTDVENLNSCSSTPKEDRVEKINDYLEIQSEKIKNDYLEIKGEEYPEMHSKKRIDTPKVPEGHKNEEIEESNKVCESVDLKKPTSEVKSSAATVTSTVSTCNSDLERLASKNSLVAKPVPLEPVIEEPKRSPAPQITPPLKSVRAPCPTPSPTSQIGPRLQSKLEQERICFPPEPPPRPAKSSVGATKFPYNRGSITKSSAKNTPHKSPRSLRKKNPLLGKRRSISVKELGICDHDGWLYHRARKGSRGSPQWIRGWFIIKGTIFYGFNSRDSPRARLMISLPGFTVSPAEEVKSRLYAFKVYHTGTTFYFAAECGEDLAGWVESFSKVTVSEEEHTIVMSETDGEEEEDDGKKSEKNKDGASHTTKIKKLSDLLTGHLLHDSSKSEKRYSSLKKNSGRKNCKEDTAENGGSNQVASASLDRKYLKFLSGGGKQNIMPVPTAQFRSYRRVPPSSVSETGDSLLENNRSEPGVPSATVSMPSVSPTRPPEMADYRLASLAKTANASNGVNGNTNQRMGDTQQQVAGYTTPENFTSMRQQQQQPLLQLEEERMQQQQQQHPQVARHHSAMLRVPQCHAPPPPIHSPATHHIATASTAVTGREEEPFPSARNISTLATSVFSVSHDHKQESINNQLDKPLFSPSLHKSPSSSVQTNQTCSDSTRNASSLRLKKTIQYQPPPWDSTTTGTLEESRLHPAFEMTLDHSSAPERTSPLGTVNKKNKSDDSANSSTGTRIKNLFTTSKHDIQKSLLSSPRLKRVLFRDKHRQNPQPSQQPEIIVQSAAPLSQISPNLESAPQTSPPTVSNTPDYPGLEYPPVFEPATYSLSDMSTILRSRSVRQPSSDNRSKRAGGDGDKTTNGSTSDLVGTSCKDNSGN